MDSIKSNDTVVPLGPMLGPVEPETTAVVIPFPLKNELADEKPKQKDIYNKLGVAAAVLYSSAIVGYPGYKAYEKLEGNDLIFANTVGSLALAGIVSVGAVSIYKKLRS